MTRSGNSASGGTPKKKDSSFPVMLLIIALACFATLLCYKLFLKEYDHGLRKAVLVQLKTLFPEVAIRIGRVSSQGPSEIVLTDVRFALQDAGGQRPLLAAQRVVVRGDLDIAHWAQQAIRVHKVELYGLQLDAFPLADGRWSLESIKPHHQPKSTPPRIEFADAVLRLSSNKQSAANSIVLHNINGYVAPVSEAALTIDGASRNSPDSKPPMKIELDGKSSGLLAGMHLDGDFDPNTQHWKVVGAVNGLHFSPRLLTQLPPQLARFMTQLSGLDCMASSSFEVIRRADQTPTFKIGGEISEGRLQDARLPYPLDHVSGNFYCNNSELQLRWMNARSGSTQVQLNTDIRGFSLNSPVEIQADAVDLELDHRLYRSLPKGVQAAWDKLRLSGRVSGAIQLSYDGEQWTPSANLRCSDVAIQPWLFPYPITDIQGPIQYQRGTVSSTGLSGVAGGTRLESSFSLSKVQQQWLGSLQLKTNSPVPIDERLLTALTPRDEAPSSAEVFVRSLHPTGTIQLKHVAFERLSIEDPLWHRTIDANVYGASIKYDNFPYPIYDIRGRLRGQDYRWYLDHFEGSNDTARIRCYGGWNSAPTDGHLPFDIRFDALDVPMEEELQAALPADGRSIWTELNPAGTVDKVQINIARGQNDSSIQTHVAVEEDNRSNAASGRSLRMTPRTFPYALTDLECKIEYEPGLVRIHHAAGQNGSSKISLRGQCVPHVDGRWQANVEWLPQTRLLVDSQLLKALPTTVRESLERMDFRGPISVIGASRILFAKREGESPVTDWDCQVDIENGRLADGKNIDNLRGTIYVQGSSNGERIRASGSVALDALTLRDVPVFGLRGPFELLDSTIYFGSKVYEVLPAPTDAPQQQMVASALSGKLTISGFGQLNSGKLFLDANLDQAELSSLLQDVGVQQASTQANCDAVVRFEGIPWNSQTWHGDGKVHLSDARLFQLPFMIRLLRTASVNANDDSAFQSADISFQIDGERIPLQVACDGDVLRLRGEGSTNLRREIDLELYSYVGRRIPIAQALSPVLNESRFATFMLIQVGGTLDNPVMQRQPFPQFASIQQLFPDMSNAANPPNTPSDSENTGTAIGRTIGWQR